MSDAINFDHNGLPCRVVQTSMGHWCGYVGVPDAHPWHRVHYHDKVTVSEAVMNRPVDVDKIGVINLLCASLSEEDKEARRLDLVLAVDAHGGLTWADTHPGGGPDDRATWWLGFDAAHAGDDPSVQDAEYMAQECCALADQIIAAA